VKSLNYRSYVQQTSQTLQGKSFKLKFNLSQIFSEQLVVQQDLPGARPAREPAARAPTRPSPGWVDLELVAVPVVVRLDWRGMKRISLFIGKGKDCKTLCFGKNVIV